jgi:hypothetical protein
MAEVISAETLLYFYKSTRCFDSENQNRYFLLIFLISEFIF